MKYPFSLKLFLCLAPAFFGFAIAGTLFHETGHYLIARCLGYHATICYNVTHTNCDFTAYPYHSFLITAGGPLQTMLTGSLGVLLLIVNRRSFANNALRISQWLMIFITLFWLRQTANLFIWLARYLFNGASCPAGDELRLAAYLRLSPWSVIGITGIIGAAVLLWVVVRFLPRDQRLTFFASGLVGGVSGYVFWVVLFGKLILP